MSHVATVQIEIKDLELLDRACGRVGLELVRGQETFRAYESGNKCEHAIRVSEAAAARLQAPDGFTAFCTRYPKSKPAKLGGAPFEIGVVARPDGKGWQLKYDDFGDLWQWGGYGLEAVAAKGLCGVKQAYAIVAARAAAVKQGFRIQELHKPNGTVELRLMR